MPRLELVTTPYCTCRLPREAEIGWERAAYLTLEAMDDARARNRRPAGLPRSHR